MNGQSQQMGLDEVIQNAARQVEEALPKGIMIAVLNFASTSETFSDYVIEELTGELVGGHKVTVVDRRRLALIREEMNLQLSGNISDESAQAIGRQLGARSIVSGSLTNLGTYYRFRVSVINVETAAIEYQVSLNLKNDPQVAFLLESGSQSAAPQVTGNTRPQAMESRTGYKIGDTGPGGGIVFFIEGNTFMEVSGTLGEHNQNSAIQIARSYRGGGFANWYLPSKEELDFIYQNLQKNGIVNFGSGRLWSSSSAGGINGWVQRFSDGRQDFVPRGNTNGVRAVRTFN